MSNEIQQYTAEQQIELLKRQSIAMLGDGQVFIKRTSEGAIRSIKSVITLEEANGEIAIIQGKAMTTGKGFYHANQIAGLSIMTPEKLTLPSGQVVVNPYPVIDEASGTLRKVWAKKMAVGYGPTGNLVITSSTLLYDINMYFIQDLLKKVQYNAGSGRICMENMLTDDEKSKGIFFRFDGMLGVWVDVSHKEILKAIDTFVNKKNFAERNAQTIAERLVLSKHPALSHIAYVNAEGPDKGKRAKVTVIGYVNDYDQNTLLELAKQAERGEEIKVGGKTVETINVTADATSVDITVDADDEEKLAATQADAAATVLGGDLF